MYPEVFAVGGLHDKLIKVGVMLEEVEPQLGDVHIRMLMIVALFGIGSEWNLDVSSFAKVVYLLSLANCFLFEVIAQIPSSLIPNK